MGLRDFDISIWKTGVAARSCPHDRSHGFRRLRSIQGPAILRRHRQAARPRHARYRQGLFLVRPRPGGNPFPSCGSGLCGLRIGPRVRGRGSTRPTWPSSRATRRRWMISIGRRSPPVAVTMANPDCARASAATTPRSCSIRTETTSRPARATSDPLTDPRTSPPSGVCGRARRRGRVVQTKGSARSLSQADQVVAQVAHVVFGAVNEARLAPAHEVESEHVQSRHARRCRRGDAGAPLRSNAGTCSQEWSGRKPVAQITVPMRSPGQVEARRGRSSSAWRRIVAPGPACRQPRSAPPSASKLSSRRASFRSAMAQ